jgi:hypothetical protein
MSLTDITNTCIYRVYPHHLGGLFYNIEVETKTSWLSIAMYHKGKLQTFGNDNKFYKIKFEKDIMKIYRDGPMRY